MIESGIESGIESSALRGYADFASRLADASGAVIRAGAARPVESEVKSDSSPVTAIDRAAEDAIRERIAQAYPNHGIVGEERGASASDAELVWIIDPIDGTLPFLAGLPVFGTLIALLHHGAPLIGIIDMPMTGERWVGCRGLATTRNAEPIQTRPCGDLAGALLSTSNPDFYGAADRPALAAMKAATRWTVYGGSCMAYAQIASGRIDIGIDVGLDPFDYLALAPVIQGAGGIITDWAGDPLTLGSGDRILAAGDPQAHARALEILAAAG